MESAMIYKNFSATGPANHPRGVSSWFIPVMYIIFLTAGFRIILRQDTGKVLETERFQS